MKSTIEKNIYKNVKTGIWGLFFTLIMGLFVREISRGLKNNINLYDFTVVSSFLELAHGHTLIFFTIIPLAIALILFLIKDKIIEFPSRKFSIYTGIMHLGLLLALILMIYKGFSYINSYQTIPDLSKIDSSLFFGNKLIRMLVYSMAHITMSVGIFGVGIIILKSYKKSMISNN